MSNDITKLLRSRKLDVGFTGKAILLLMGDIASDDGTGIYASKARMARELETTERTIQRTIKTLISRRFLRKTGRQKHRNGHTFEYEIRVENIQKCDLSTPQPPTECRVSPQDVDEEPQDIAPDRVSPPTECHPTPDTPSPQDPTECRVNPITTQIEPKSPPVVPQTENPPDETEEALSVYHQFSEQTGWPKVQKMTQARRSALRARLKDVGGLEGWRAAIERASRSSLLTGSNNRGWMASFDFFVRQSSFLKLMEGNYDDRPHNPTGGPSGPGDRPTGDARARGLERAAAGFQRAVHQVD